MPDNSATHPGASRALFLRLLLMAVGGATLSLAFPNEILPGRLGDHPSPLLAWVALLPLGWGLLALPPRQARWGVWLYGVTFYLGVVSWVRLFGYLPWALLAAYLSLTPWLSLLVTQKMRLPRHLVPLGYAVMFTGLEWLRGQGMFGLAWGEIGASQVDAPTAVLASLGGLPLITFLLLWCATNIVLVFLDRGRSPRWVLPTSFGLLVVLCVVGWRQEARIVARWADQPSQQVSVVQPSTLRGLTPDALVTGITPEERLRREEILFNLTRTARGQATGTTPRLILWPESALGSPPGYPAYRLSDEVDSYLLVGAPYYHYTFHPLRCDIMNSAYLLTPDGREQGRYSKMHLVPFGEFVPFRPLISRFYTVRDHDIRPGSHRAPLPVGPHRVGVGICFESTDAGIAREYAQRGAHLLVYITNDAWFHRTSAVRQHFNHARFRALETGLPVARAASTGISGFIAPDGRILAEIPTYAADAATRTLPDGTPGTIATAVGWLFGPCCLFLALLLLAVGCRGKRRHSSENPTPAEHA